MKSSAFVIPKGLNFKHTSSGIIIEHEGDIILEGDIGSSIQKIVSTEGDIHISVPLEAAAIIAPNGKIHCSETLVASHVEAQIVHSNTDLTVRKELNVRTMRIDGDLNSPKLFAKGNISVLGSVHVSRIVAEADVNIGGNLTTEHLFCGGSLSASGDISANNIESTGSSFSVKGSIRANELVADSAEVTLKTTSSLRLLRAHSLLLDGDEHNCKAIQIHNHAAIESTTVHSDVLFCQSIAIAQKTLGKITVLESKEAPNLHRIKGCLQLADLEDFIPDVDLFLSQRGIRLNADSSTTTTQDISSPLAAFAQPPTTEHSFDNKEEIDESEDLEESGPAVVVMPSVESPEPIEESLEEKITEIKLDETEKSDIESKDEHYSDEDLIQDEEKELSSLEEPESNSPSNQSIEDDIADDPLEISEEAMDNILEEESSSESDNEEALFLQEVRSDVQALIDLYPEAPSAIESLQDIIDSEDLYYLRDELIKIWQRLLRFHNTQVPPTRFPKEARTIFNELTKKLSKL